MTQIFMLTALCIFMLSGCKKDESFTQTQLSAGAQNENLTCKMGSAKYYCSQRRIHTAAVNNASNNAVIFIEAGTYKEAISVDKPGIKLIGELSA
jgi:pectin methylesterase-like acyl-CoA thioesterase